MTRPEQAHLWTDVSAKGWTHEHTELLNFFLESTAISSIREQSTCFLAEFDGQPSAAGSLCIHQGVALFAGAATVPHMRRLGATPNEMPNGKASRSPTPAQSGGYVATRYDVIRNGRPLAPCIGYL